MTTAETKPPVKPRISAKLRRAIVERARGSTIKSARPRAGMSESGFYAALERPHAKELLSKELSMVIEEGTWLWGAAKARGLEVALELFETSVFESIKVRLAVALLNIREQEVPAVSVAIGPRPWVAARCED